jgi:transcriptional regulator GlxA family with amidase domain
MFSVGVIAPSECASITMVGLFDVIGRADRALGVLEGRPGSNTRFDVKLLGLDGTPVRYRDRVQVTPDVAAPDVADLDLLVVPGLDDDLDRSFELNREWSGWIRTWHAAGATVASSCSGAFLVAEAGVLDGRSATTHWLYADRMAAAYPTITVLVDRLLIDHGDVITSGGATTFLDLALYLTERFGGRERANAAARLLLIDRDRHSQLPYVVPTGSDRNHRDRIVHQVQDLVDQGLGDELRVDELAACVGLSPRSLGRRCRAALGTTPRAYIRRRRIEQATRELETTTASVDMVRRRVGYHDATSFRRAFKAATGLSPTDYRGRYQWTAPS